MTEKEALVALNLVNGLGSIKINTLLRYFKTAKAVFNASVEELKKVEGINNRLISNILKITNSIELKEELELSKRKQIRVIGINDKDYPKNLKQISDPPAVLYVKGNILQSDELAIGVVGSRQASFYGLNFAEKIAYELANLGITVVSGMARGIDTKAHKGALRSKGRTIAVLGSGLNKIYPSENHELSRQIEESGAVISEFGLNTSPLPGNFPCRNRVISGLSLGVVVVEAARNSGALITARLGLEQGREIFSVPGRVDSKTSWGTNQLIRDGAKLCNSLDDILEELKPHLKEKIKQINNVEEDSEDIPIKLNSEESSLYNILSSQPMHFDEIVTKSNLALNKTLSGLLQLELKHLVRQLPGKVFVKAH